MKIIAATAALVPLAAWAAAVFFAHDPARPFALSMLREYTADALLYTAMCVIVAGPVTGVALAARARRPAPESAAPEGAALRALRPLRALAIVAASFSAGSALVTWAAAGGGTAVLPFVGSAHVTIGAVALALGALGLFCAAAFRDPLDAVACSLLVTLVAAGAVLFGGAAIAQMPGPMVDIALVASPIVAIGSAAHIDLARMDLLYQISPLAHMGIESPAWGTSVACYLGAAIVFIGGTFRISGTTRAALPRHRAFHTSHVS